MNKNFSGFTYTFGGNRYRVLFRKESGKDCQANKRAQNKTATFLSGRCFIDLTLSLHHRSHRHHLTEAWMVRPAPLVEAVPGHRVAGSKRGMFVPQLQ